MRVLSEKMNVFAKYLTGELETINPKESMHDIIVRLARSSCVHPSQVRLITEDISEQDREMGIAYYVLFVLKPTVKLSFTFDSPVFRPEYVWRWIRYCVNDDLIDYFLANLNQPAIRQHLYANPHPKVVEMIISSFPNLPKSVYANPSPAVVEQWCTETFAYDPSLCFELSSNSNETVVEFLCRLIDRGEPIDWPIFGRLKSEKAVLRTVQAIREGQTRLEWFIDCPRICEELGISSDIFADTNDTNDKNDKNGLWSDDLREVIDHIDEYTDAVTILSCLGRRNDCHVVMSEK